jgi:hypothetical protein
VYAGKIVVPESPDFERGLEAGRRMTFDDAATYVLRRR